MTDLQVTEHGKNEPIAPTPPNLHTECPAPIWHGVEWLCHAHSPPQVVVKNREPHIIPEGHAAVPGGAAASPSAVAAKPAAKPAAELAAKPAVELAAKPAAAAATSSDSKDVGAIAVAAVVALGEDLQKMRAEVDERSGELGRMVSGLAETIREMRKEQAGDADRFASQVGSHFSLAEGERRKELEGRAELEARLLALVSAAESPLFRRERNHWRFYSDNAGEWRWQLKDTNGKVLGDSNDGYKNMTDIQSNAGRHGWDEAQATEIEEKAD